MSQSNWTDDEKQILRDIYAAGQIAQQLHRLPGRTIGGAWRQATRLGLKRFYPCDWTPEEDSIVRDAYATGTPLKVALKNLPGRTHRGIRSRAEFLGISGKFNGKTGTTYSWVAEAVKSILAEGVPMSSRKIALHTDASLPSIQRVAGRMHGKGIYIAGWEPVCNGYAAIWMLGNLKDAPKPAPVDPAIRCRIYRRNKRRAREFNPFATVLGQVSAPAGTTGRVFKQDMKSYLRDEELEAA